MDVSVIIVSYDTYAYTHNAIASAFDTADNLQIEVVVIDNNSPDRSAPRLRIAFPSETYRITIVQNAENKGFSAANNQGVELSTGRYLFFLNPDTVVHKGAIQRLVTFLDKTRNAGAIGPRVLNSDGTDQVSIASFTNAWRILSYHIPILSFLRGRDRREDLIPAETRQVDVVKGCAIMIDRHVLSAVGGWDERYFMYSEETELCRSLVHAGCTNYFVRDAVITHFGGQSSMSRYAEQQVIQQRSALQYLRHHHSMFVRIVHRLSGLVGFGTRALIFPLLAYFRPAFAQNYKLRGEAAARLFRWFLLEYS